MSSYEKCGFIDVRKYLREFLTYVLYCDDFTFNSDAAIALFLTEYRKLNQTNRNILISDEQFCGSPWDNAISRKRYFDRLNSIFPSASFIIILRNQEDMVRSLYLQYIKTGGACSWKEFLSSKKHPLEFGLKSYLNYGSYIKYMVRKIGVDRLGCFFYEDMKEDPFLFLKAIATFSGFEIDNNVKSIIGRKENPSISEGWVFPLIFVNKLFKSYRQPFLLLPRKLRTALLKMMVSLSNSSSSKSNIIPDETIVSFCKEPKLYNEIIAEFYSNAKIGIGY